MGCGMRNNPFVYNLIQILIDMDDCVLRNQGRVLYHCEVFCTIAGYGEFIKCFFFLYYKTNRYFIC